MTNVEPRRAQALDFFSEVYELSNAGAVARQITTVEDLLELNDPLGVTSMQSNEAEIYWEELFARVIPESSFSPRVYDRLSAQAFARLYTQLRAPTVVPDGTPAHQLMSLNDDPRGVRPSQAPILRATMLREVAARAAGVGFSNYGNNPGSGTLILNKPVPGYIDSFVSMGTFSPMRMGGDQTGRYAVRDLFSGAMNLMPSGAEAEAVEKFNYPGLHELHFDTRFLQRSLADTLTNDLGEDYAELSPDDVRSVVEEFTAEITDGNVVVDPEMYVALLAEIQERLEGKKPGHSPGVHQARWGKPFVREAYTAQLLRGKIL